MLIFRIVIFVHVNLTITEHFIYHLYNYSIICHLISFRKDR